MPLLYYGNPDADCRTYDKVMIEPVTLWAMAEDSPLAALDPQDRGMLANLGYRALHDVANGAGFRVVQQPGPGVIRVRAAFTEADKADVPLKEFSALWPLTSVAPPRYGPCTRARPNSRALPPWNWKCSTPAPPTPLCHGRQADRQTGPSQLSHLG